MPPFSARRGAPCSRTPARAPTHPAPPRLPRAALPPSPHRAPQTLMLDACNRWSESNHATLRGECEQLTAAAVAAPGSLLEQPLAVAADRVQLAFRCMVIAHKCVGVNAIFRPRQLAACYVASFPYLTSWNDILRHLPRAPPGVAP
jgi:hypothetical protein